jgi:hypothetical protein
MTSGSSLLEPLRAHAIGAGLNLFGVVDRERFDAGEPKECRVGAIDPRCGTVIVLGSGGRWLAEQRMRWATEAPRGHVPGIDAIVVAATVHLAANLQERGVRCRMVTFDGRHRLRAERLGEAAGFGSVSPVSGMLLHPEFGPWLRVRAVLLCEGAPFGAVADASISERFHPCCGCARPCVAACPASVHDGQGHRDLARCGTHRHKGGCAAECATRSACPLGSEHRDGPAEAVHSHTYELAALQRWLGMGVWRWVPKALRGGPR